MGEKKMLLLALAGMMALSIISAYIAIHSSDNECETIIVVESESQYESEYTTESMEIHEDSAIEKTEAAAAATTENITETESATEKLWVNINTADIAELTELNGIGEVLAAKIVEYREINGGFRNIEELIEVDGIGERTLDKLRNNIYVDNPYYDEYAEQSVTEEVISEEITYAQEETDVPATEEPTDEPTTEHIRTLEEAAPININTADAEELTLLPYVTEEIAEKIINLRNEIKGYSHPYELLYIEGLEQNQVAEIIEFVTVGQ